MSATVPRRRLLAALAGRAWRPPGQCRRAAGAAAREGCSRREAVSLFDSIEHSQEMMALSHRNVMEQLIQEVRRRRKKFTIPKRRPSMSSIDGAKSIDPDKLLEKLRRNPTATPLMPVAAESLVLALEHELQDLASPVLDISLPSKEFNENPQLVVVGDTHGQLQDVLHIFEKRGTPSPSVTYLFNGDIVDRGKHAVEIWLLLIAFKLRYPNSVHILRGNHENEQMITRPLKMGGGFAEECLTKYSRPLLAAFQRAFKLLPLFAVLEEEVFVVHGGLFRNPAVNLARLRSLPEASWRRNYPNPLTKEQVARGECWSEEEEIIFDAQWADPHNGTGSRPSTRGRVAMMFGEDVTQRFLEQAGLSLCIRSHRVPQSGHGFEFEHGGRLLTLFSASRYGGVLHNRGAVVVLERADGGGGGSSSSSCTTPTPPLRRMRLSVFEHDVAAPAHASKSQGASQGWSAVADAEQLSASTATQVRRIVEQHVREHEVDMEMHALGLICSEREELWRRCRQYDAAGTGLVPRGALCDLLDEVCGELGWGELLWRAAPGLSGEVAYGEFLATPRVHWFHLGPAQVINVARATAQAELQLPCLAALFDSLNDGVVTPQLTRRALKQLLPSLREHQRQQLAVALFGSETTELSAVLHRLALFADPPRLEEPWMQPALRRLAELIEKHHGPPPLHCALIRFFKCVDHEGTGLLRADEFVKGLQDLCNQARAFGDTEVPMLHSGRLYKLFEVIDGNRTGTVAFLELLLALDERSDRPELPEFGAMEGAIPALLLVHKVAMLRICRAMDIPGKGSVSGENFIEVVAALSEVVGRPLGGAARLALEDELKGEDLHYAEALSSFEVSAEGGPWRWGGHP